jgi:GTP-binding protein
MTKIKIAIIGRSNVGKSSLINYVLGRGELAKTSKHPGKTRKHQLIPFDTRIDLVDMPGYGYAKTRGANRQLWDAAMQQLFFGDDLLRSVLVLIDSSIPLMQIDKDFLTWLREHNLSHSIVFTKIDKGKTTEVTKNINQWNVWFLESGYPAVPLQFLISSVKKQGASALKAHIATTPQRSEPV